MDSQIEQATLLTYDGWGHGVYHGRDCVTSATDRHFVDGVVPPEDTHCAPSKAPRGRVSTLETWLLRCV